MRALFVYNSEPLAPGLSPNALAQRLFLFMIAAFPVLWLGKLTGRPHGAHKGHVPAECSTGDHGMKAIPFVIFSNTPWTIATETSYQLLAGHGQEETPAGRGEPCGGIAGGLHAPLTCCTPPMKEPR